MCLLGGREVLFKTEEGKPASAPRTNRVWNEMMQHLENSRCWINGRGYDDDGHY